MNLQVLNKKNFNLSKVIWLTGLSGSGKSTISNQLYKILKNKGFKVLQLDGDTFRKRKKTTKKFSKNNIINNNKMIIKEVKNKIAGYNFVIVSVISPLRETRIYAKKTFKKNYFEVNTFCNQQTLIKRDTKGLYKLALKKKINNLIGFNSKIKYQKSKYKIIKIDTNKLSVNRSAKFILNKINL